MSSGIKSAVQVGSRSTLGSMPTIVLMGMILMATLRPVVAPDFWWHMARGRAVLEGSLQPSKQLLAFEPYADADWLSGLPWYVVYQIGGVSLTSWLPPLIVVLAGYCLATDGHSPKWQRVAVILLGVIAANQSVTPSPAFLELVGVMAFWSLSKRFAESPRVDGALWFGQFLWSNFAPLSLLGPTIFWFTAASSPERRSRTASDPGSIPYGRLWRCLVGLLIAGSLTPRGIFTFWDSLRTLLPWTVASLNDLHDAELQSILRWPLSLEGYAFVGLLTVTVLQWWCHASEQRSGSRLVVLVVTTCIALSAHVNVAPAALWLTLEVLTTSTARDTSSHTSIKLVRGSENVFQVLTAGLFAVAAIMAAGWIHEHPTRIGWGISPQLEPLLLEHVLRKYPVDGTAFCTGIAEAGMLAWIRPGSIRPADAPCRALLSGRLNAHLNLMSELACGWRDQHRRSQSGWGGWLLELSDLRTRLLLISPQRTQIIHELETANWKPIAIDTPSVPYALAGDPVLSPGIAFGQSSLSLVDHGEWIYPDPRPAGMGSHFDLYGWATGSADPQISVRQSQTLAAMGRNIAALRVLKNDIRRQTSAVRSAFIHNQAALAYKEFLATGTRSEWRTLAYELGGGQRHASSLVPAATATPSESDSKALISAASAYVAGDWYHARDQLQSLGTPSALLALSQVELELSHPQATVQVLRELTTKFPNSPASIAGQYVLSQVSD